MGAGTATTGESVGTGPCLAATAQALRDGLRRVRDEAEMAVRSGALHLVLSDERIDDERCAIPMILAVGGVHTHLVAKGLRTFTSLNARAAECLDVHYFAVLIGVGATTVNAYLAQETIRDRHRRGLFGDVDFDTCMQRFRQAVDQGLLKIMSKMGISVLSSYRGGYNFEAVGLSRALVARFFPGMSSRISGLGLSGIQQKVLRMHAKAFDEAAVPLPVGASIWDVNRLLDQGRRTLATSGLVRHHPVACNICSDATCTSGTSSPCPSSRRRQCPLTSSPRRSPKRPSSSSAAFCSVEQHVPFDLGERSEIPPLHGMEQHRRDR